MYVRELGATKTHDEFYTNETIIAAFENYTTQVVSRYVNCPSVLAWCVAVSKYLDRPDEMSSFRELANDPRYCVLHAIFCCVQISALDVILHFRRVRRATRLRSLPGILGWHNTSVQLIKII